MQLSRQGRTIPANTRKRQHIYQGKFDTGIAEAMGLLGEVLVRCKYWREMSVP